MAKHDPEIALYADNDGLAAYEQIAKNAVNLLKDNGKIYLEIGYDQADAVKKIFENAGYTHIETIKDFSQNDRVIVFKK